MIRWQRSQHLASGECSDHREREMSEHVHQVRTQKDCQRVVPLRWIRRGKERLLRGKQDIH